MMGVMKRIRKIIGAAVAGLALVLIYALVALPTGIAMKLARRDRLWLKRPRGGTYWKDAEARKSDYELQF